MKNAYLILLIISCFFGVEAQSIDEKIESLMIADGTIRNVEYLISENIDFQSELHPSISDAFKESLNAELLDESIPKLIELVIPIYKDSYSENQIDELLNFYRSDVGKNLVNKQPELDKRLNMPLIEWIQDVQLEIIHKIENRGNEVPSSQEIEKFEQDLKNKLGIVITNLSELTIDYEHNPGSLLIDFGEVDGIMDITRYIVVKNITDSVLTMEKPLFALNNDINFAWEDTSLKPNEERAFAVALNAKTAEGDRYSFMNIRFSNGAGFPLGIKYNIAKSELEYALSADSLSYKEFTSEFSDEYEFVLSNNGRKSFRIFEIEMDKSIAYLYYDRDMIEPDESTTIKVLFNKEFVSDIEDVELTLDIKLTKTVGRDMYTFPDKILQLKIK